MAYDEELADRVRGLLGREVVHEQRMFGGLAFLVGGRMGVAVGEGGLLVRVDPAETEALLREPGAEQMRMGARGPMRGWLRVTDEALTEDRMLDVWVRRGVAYASSLPPR